MVLKFPPFSSFHWQMNQHKAYQVLFIFPISQLYVSPALTGMSSHVTQRGLFLSSSYKSIDQTTKYIEEHTFHPPQPQLTMKIDQLQTPVCQKPQ